jgi:arylsulfatase A-like enzyme
MKAAMPTFKLSRRELLTGSAATAVTGVAAHARGHVRSRKKIYRDQIVLIMLDDLFSIVYNRDRFGMRLRAPNLFALMDRGVTFTNAFATTALCNPSRTAIISGRNPFKTGVTDNTIPWHDKVDIQSTFPGIMHAAGYRCFIYGKITHGGPDDLPALWVQAGICEEAIKPPIGPWGTRDRAISAAAIHRIHSDLSVNTTDKWLLMVGFMGSHSPFGDVPALLAKFPLNRIIPVDWDGDPKSVCFVGNGGFGEMTEDDLKAFIQGYFADIMAMDIEIGRLLNFLDASGVTPTILLASDHGYSLGDHDEVGKFTLWDDADRAPLIVSWPGCPAGMVVPQTVSLIDIGPTSLHQAGITRPSYFDGDSLLPIINQGSIRTSGAMTTMDDSVSFRDNQYRITRYAPCAALNQFTYELYDQVADPESRNNLFYDSGFESLGDTMLAKLDAKLAQWTA